MTQLAVDCSFTGLSLALKTGTQTHVFSTATARSSDLLPTELQNILIKSGTAAADITDIYVTTGPGSFTGIRLGLATAEALKLVNPAINITGLSTLHALAIQIKTDHKPANSFTVVLDAAGGQLYTQNFNSQAQPESPAACIPLGQLPVTSHQSFLFAQQSLMLPLPAMALESFSAAHLFTLAENPAAHLPAQPVYLKPLTYKLAP